MTSLKDTQATIRDHWLKNSSSSSYDSVLLVHKIQVQSIIKKIFENKDVNQTAQRKDLAESKRLLTVEEEAYLVQLCKLLAKSGHGLDRDKVLTCFNLIAPSTVGSHSQKAVDRFFKRNPDIKLKGSSGIDPLRASQANEYVRDTFFFKLDALVGQLYAMGLIKWKTFAEIPSKFIYNMDELASDTTQRRNKIAADSESNVRNYTITPEGDRMPFHVTVCLSTRADGQYICPADEITEGAPPPVIIHSKPPSADPNAAVNPYKLTDALARGLAEMKDCTSSLDAYEKNNDLGFLALATPNGSMKQCTMLPYAKHFVENLPAERDPLEGIFLLLDGHSSRWDLPALRYLYEHNVFPFFFPSHTSIWSQANDNGTNKRLHSCIEAEASKLRSGSCLTNSKFKPSDWNKIFRLAWRSFLEKERVDYRVVKSNATTNSYVKTGIAPFNPRCQSWTEAVTNLGLSSTKQNQRFQKGFEVTSKAADSPVVLNAVECKDLFSGYTECTVIVDGKAKTVRSAVQLAKAMLARWRDKFEEMREKLLSLVQADVLPGDYNARVRNETEFDSEEKEMLKELLLLHPKDFEQQFYFVKNSIITFYYHYFSKTIIRMIANVLIAELFPAPTWPGVHCPRGRAGA